MDRAERRPGGPVQNRSAGPADLFTIGTTPGRGRRAAGRGRRLLTDRNCGRSGLSSPDFCKNVNRLKT